MIARPRTCAAVVMLLLLGLGIGPGPSLGLKRAIAQPVPDAVGVDDTDPLIVEIWTFGPGDHPFTRFGHNALRIVDRRAHTDTAYNFGTFAIGSKSLIGEFLQKRLRYWLSTSSTIAMARSYERENRSIEVQRLALTPAQKLLLASRLDINARPENRDYQYDYFGDNCSTRVRDAVDGALGGRLRALARQPGTDTLRGHALRMTADAPWLYVALLIVLGPTTDRPIDEWAEDFLPSKLQEMVRRLNVATGEGDSVVAPARSLVESERVVFVPARAPVRTAAPQWGLRFFFSGLLLGAILAALGRWGTRAKLARVAYGITIALLGLFCGALGLFLLGAWGLTPHAAVYRNQNLFLLAPTLFALSVLGVGVALGRAGAIRKSFVLCALSAALALLALIVKIVPAAVMSHQDNGYLIAFFLPLWLGTTWGAWALRSSATARARSNT